MSEMRRYMVPGFCVLLLILALHTMTIASGIAPGLAVEPLTIHTATGERHEFQAHLADTPEARARGLMYVTRLEPDQGMLFDFEQPQVIHMWMKNTPLSLDMVFITEDGVVARIVARTRPFSTEIITSGVPVRGVLEINGGLAAKLGIAPGDRVEHRIFAAPLPADDPEDVLR